MELSLTLQLERMTLGEAVEPTNSPSSSPSTPDSSPTYVFPLFSLPPELAQMILEMVAEQDAVSARNGDLARLSRVNKAIQAVVQPLLYRDFYLDHGILASIETRDNSFVVAHKHKHWIETLRLSFRGYRMKEPDGLTLDTLLRSLPNLHTIRTCWNRDSFGEEVDSPILKTVLGAQPQLLRLELPHVRLSMRGFRLISSSLPYLETLVVHLPKLTRTGEEFKPVFCLHRLVALELPDPLILSSLLSNSVISLTSLSLSLTSNSDLPPFASFSQLGSLSLWIPTPKRSRHDFLNDETDRAMIIRMQEVLVSVKELPIKIVKIGSPISFQLYDVNEIIFANLPRSIESFTFGPKNDGTIDWRSLLPSKTSSPYPFLKHLSMTRLPRSIRRTPGSSRGAQGDLKQLCLEAGIKLELLPVTHLHRFSVFILDSPRVLGGEYDDDIASEPEIKISGMYTDRGYVPLPYGL